MKRIKNKRIDYSSVAKFFRENLKRTWMFLIITVLFIALRFVVLADDVNSSSSAQINNTDHIDEIVKGDTYIQKLTCDQNGLNGIELYLSTFNRINSSNLNVSLYDGHSEIQKWSIKCNTLSDNSYYKLKMDNRIKNSKGKKYTLQITSDAKKGQGITILSNNKKGATGLSYNGKKLSETLCYVLDYKQGFRGIWNKPSNAFHLNIYFIVTAILLLFSIYAPHIRIENAILFIWIALGMMYLTSSTIFNAPDEENHFLRAEEISLGHISSELNNTGTAGGRELPFYNINFDDFEKNWETYENNKDLTYTKKLQFKVFSNTALYSPISYLPSATAISIVRLFTPKIATAVYAGRIANFLMVTILMYLTLCMLPRGKLFAGLVFLMPMSVSEAVTLAPDAMVLAVSSFMIANVLKIKYRQKRPMSNGQKIFLYILAVIISLYKIVYLPFCLLYFLIPAEKWGGSSKKIFHAGLMILIVGISSLIWMHQCSQFLVIPGTDSATQLLEIIKHPLNYIIIIFRTLFNLGDWWITTMIGGLLAELNVNTSAFIMIIYGCLMIVVLIPSHAKERAKLDINQIVFLLIVISIVILTNTSLYLQWTSVNSNTISGIQGRYFIPLLIPLYFICNRISPQIERENLRLSTQKVSIILIANICACAALLFNCLS